MPEHAPSSIWTHHLLVELYARFDLIIVDKRVLRNDLNVTVSKLAFIAISTRSSCNPVLAHFSFVLRIVIFLIKLILDVHALERIVGERNERIFNLHWNLRHLISKSWVENWLRLIIGHWTCRGLLFDWNEWFRVNR